LRTRCFIPTDCPPQRCKDRLSALSPLRALKAELLKPRAKIQKPTPIDDGLHATPSNGCDQDLYLPSVPIPGITYPPHRLVIVLLIPFFRINFQLPPWPCLQLVRDDPRLSVQFSTPGTITATPQSVFRERSAPPRRIVHFYTSPNICVCGCIIGTSAPPSRLFTASDYYSPNVACYFCEAHVLPVHETGTMRRSQTVNTAIPFLNPTWPKYSGKSHASCDREHLVLEIQWICVSHHSQGLRLAGPRLRSCEEKQCRILGHLWCPGNLIILFLTKDFWIYSLASSLIFFIVPRTFLSSPPLSITLLFFPACRSSEAVSREARKPRRRHIRVFFFPIVAAPYSNA